MPPPQSLSFPIHELPADERNVDLGTILATLSFQPLKFARGKFVTASAGGALRAPRRTSLTRVYEVADVGVVGLVEIDHVTSGGSFIETKNGTLIEVAGQSVRVIAEIDAAGAGRAGATWEHQREYRPAGTIGRIEEVSGARSTQSLSLQFILTVGHAGLASDWGSPQTPRPCPSRFSRPHATSHQL
jgi:hypothetical protein